MSNYTKRQKKDTWSVDKLKQVLNFLAKIGACTKVIDVSDKIDCMYQFADRSGFGLELDVNSMKSLPNCVTVRQYLAEGNEEDDTNEIIVTFYVSDNPVEVPT